MDLWVDPDSPDTVEDPYLLFDWMRQVAPVSFDPASKTWRLISYENVSACLADSRFVVAPRIGRILQRFPAALNMDRKVLSGALAKWLFFSDPPDHTRLRALLMRAFTPGLLKRQEQRMQNQVEALLNRAIERSPAGTLELMQQFALPLPAIILSDLLGAHVDIKQLIGWSSALANFIGKRRLTMQEIEAACDTLAHSDSYFREVISQRRASPGKDLISSMLTARDRNDAISDDEIVAISSLLVGAGQETTTNLIGNGMLALLREPALAEELRVHPEYMDTAIDEFLRYDSPVQITTRVARDNVEIAGHLIEAGHFVDLVLGAANRDPAQFTDADRIVLTRSPNRHLAFGSGLHFCLGAYLSRMQARSAFTILLRRFPHMQLASYQRRPNFSFRGLTSLQISYRA